MTKSDNEIAIDMLNDISAMLKGIEFNDVDKIFSALESLRDNTRIFYNVFYSNLISGAYCSLNSGPDIAPVSSLESYKCLAEAMERWGHID